MAKRVAVVRLIMQGHYAFEIAGWLNIHRQTVSKYVKKFNQGGMDSLLHREYAPGKTPFLSPEEGYGCETCRDTRILQEVLKKKFAVTMSRSGIGDMLKRWGFSYTRPTYTLKRADRKKQKAFQKELDMIKKTRQTS